MSPKYPNHYTTQYISSNEVAKCAIKYVELPKQEIKPFTSFRLDFVFCTVVQTCKATKRNFLSVELLGNRLGWENMCYFIVLDRKIDGRMPELMYCCNCLRGYIVCTLFCIFILYMQQNSPSVHSLFFSELIPLYSVPIRPTAVEIWALEGCSVALVFYHPGYALSGAAEFRTGYEVRSMVRGVWNIP